VNRVLLTVLSLTAGCSSRKEALLLTVGPFEDDLAAAVLSAELPIEISKDSTVSLLAEGKSEGSRLTAQVEPLGKMSRVHWVARDLKKGSKTRLVVRILAVDVEKNPRIQPERGPDGSIAIDLGPLGGCFYTRIVAGPEAAKPYLYPLFIEHIHFTRRYPMEEFPGEDRDHVHQRSFWFTHGDVEGVDFWSEGPKAGKIRQKEVLAAEYGHVFARVATRNEWIAPDGRKLLDDVSEYRFYEIERLGAMIDFTITLTASGAPVTFGDTKEGTFGIRLAESMKEKRGGRIENSRGQVGMKNAWGKPAEWIDYTGKVQWKFEDKRNDFTSSGEDTFGVAIFDHPTSFRHPTTWHVRDYGLFAANPFGLRDFTGDKTKDGSYRLEKGQSITFRYRVYFHRGTTEEAKVGAIYRAYAKPPAVRVEPAEPKKE